MNRVAEILKGGVDLHVHPTPSPFPHRIDIGEAAEFAAELGFEALVMKSHHHSTVTDVRAVESRGLEKTGVKVFGGIALNGPVGGRGDHRARKDGGEGDPHPAGRARGRNISPIDREIVEEAVGSEAERAERESLGWLAASEGVFSFWENGENGENGEDGVWDEVARGAEG